MYVHPCTKLKQVGGRRQHTGMRDRLGAHLGHGGSYGKSCDRSRGGGDVAGSPKCQLIGGDVSRGHDIASGRLTERYAGILVHAMFPEQGLE